MGCGHSTPQLQQPQDNQAAAAAGEDHQGRSPNNNNKSLSCLIRRRVDSIRRRRKRVGDEAITMEETTTLSSPINNDDNKTMIISCKAQEKINDDNRGSVVVMEAVCRAIEDVLLSEEREYNAALQLLNHKSVSSNKDNRVVKRQTFVPQSPSFRVYCTRVDSFDSNSSSTKFNNHNAVKDIEKTKHGRRKSMETGSSEEDEGSTRSSKNKIEGGQKREITKKAGGSNWKLGTPLGNGMKNLFVMSSCYSCSPNNRDRLLSRG